MRQLHFCCVPSMVLIQLVQVQPRVFTAKCSEPQASISNGMDVVNFIISKELLGNKIKDGAGKLFALYPIA